MSDEHVHYVLQLSNILHDAILLEETDYSWVLTGLDARITPHLQFEFKYKVLQNNSTRNSENPEPQMGFGPTTLLISNTDALTTELLETLW